jgi:hypothetical protein
MCRYAQRLILQRYDLVIDLLQCASRGQHVLRIIVPIEDNQPRVEKPGGQNFRVDLYKAEFRPKAALFGRDTRIVLKLVVDGISDRVLDRCNPQRIGRQRIRPARFTVRDRGASLSKAKCVRVSL